MSLQNKKLQLLGQDEHQEDSDVEDLFSQYGSDDDQASITFPAQDAVAPTTMRPQDDPIEEVVETLNQGVELEVPDPKNNGTKLPANAPVEDDVIDPEEEKQWEKDLEKNGVVSPAVAVPSDAIENTKKAAPSVVPPINENYNAVMEGSQSVRPSQQTKASKVNNVPKKDIPKREIHIDPSKKTILIVDDDIDTLEMYADVFENADYNVIRAIDGLDALNVISDHTPNLIFTGIVMPRMDGFTMMESLKQNQRTAEIPVVINSHLGRAHDKKKAEDLGAKDFIVRGFTPPREALERIGALLMRNEYVFRFDHNDQEARKLAKDLGAGNFFVCPRGQEMVLKLSITDPKDLKFSARFSCVDEKKKK